LPLLRLLNHRVGDLRDQVTGHLGTVDMGQMIGDIAGRHPLRITLSTASSKPASRRACLGTTTGLNVPARSLATLMRTSRTSVRHRLTAVAIAHFAGPRPLAAVMAEMLAQLDIQLRFQHLLDQPGQQPTRPGQLNTLPAAQRSRAAQPTRTDPVQQQPRPNVVLPHISDLRGHA
jgi:hypothetical protein